MTLKHPPAPSPPLETKGSSSVEEEDPDSPKSRPPRVNGLAAPHSRDQFISCSGHVISGVAFYIGLGCLMLPSNPSNRAQTNHAAVNMTFPLVVLAIHIATMALLVVAWISCERCNPGEISSGETCESSSWLGVVLDGPRWDKTRYCAICRKTIPGMDHHCTWLNTCIGRRNYAQFFTIAVCGNILFMLQAVVSVYCSSWNYTAHLPTDGAVRGLAQSAFVVSAVVSVPCLVMYSTLLAFHVYLSWQGYGTYDYFLKRRDVQRAERRKKRDAQMEAQVASIQGQHHGEPATAVAVVV
ncbi:hypothetical protein DYB28_008965 [Aphanomyces astaci]|uniref:Palmitoyltransferase n=1 Tax=Aphanomyces astaci TaxID=112090 RepID=A0A9X8E767_APHAT|nr:hypothetical protein DYB28_008965 [Aphanomyces astaci]